MSTIATNNNHILLVEDDESLQLLYTQELTRDGYQVIPASSVEDALSILDKKKIDLMVLELHLPQMDGFDLLGRIGLKHNNMKVIINTTHAGYKDTITSRIADAYLVKSSNLNELKTTIYNCLFSSPQS